MLISCQNVHPPNNEEKCKMENGADSHKDEAGKEEHALLKQGV